MAGNAGPVSQFLDLLNQHPELVIRYLDDPASVLDESGIEFDPESRRILIGRDPGLVREALLAELGDETEGYMYSHMYTLHKHPPTIDWADGDGQDVDPPLYQGGLAYVNLLWWPPHAFVDLAVDGVGVTTVQVDAHGRTSLGQPASFEWPVASYTRGDHVVDAHVDMYDQINASTTVYVAPLD